MENKFMNVAIEMAKKAYKKNEVPIGAIIVKNNKIISKAYNRREKTQNAILHAEVDAIIKACKKLKSWRLDDCEMYVTLKPCPMCAGAIVNARIKTVFYGAKDTNDNNNLFEQIVENNLRLNHKTQHFYLPNENSEYLLKSFFKSKRNK